MDIVDFIAIFLGIVLEEVSDNGEPFSLTVLFCKNLQKEQEFIGRKKEKYKNRVFL